MIYMNSRLMRGRISLLLLLLLSGCGGLTGSAEFQPLRFNPVPWQDGEVSTYRITDSNNEYAGMMTMSIAAPDSESWRLVRLVDGRTQEEVDVVIKSNNLRPLSSRIKRSDSEGSESVVATYNGGQIDLELTTKTNVVTYERQSVPSDTYDFQTVLMLLRTLPLTNGYATRLNAYLPIAGLLSRIEVTVNGKETLTTGAGSYDAWKLLLRSQTSQSEAWIGAEAPYPLLKYIDGTTGATFEFDGFQTE